MNVACPDCRAFYRIDPERVPEGGARTRCRECGAGFLIDPGWGTLRPGTRFVGGRLPEGESEPAPESEPESEPAPESEPPYRPPPFDPADPEVRAHRLARALVSDIKAYNRDRWTHSRAGGTLRKEFKEDILRSWQAYVDQVGEPTARGTPFFRDALNDILAGGERVF